MFIYLVYRIDNREIVFHSSDEGAAVKMCNNLNKSSDVYDWRGINLNFVLDFFLSR